MFVNEMSDWRTIHEQKKQKKEGETIGSKNDFFSKRERASYT